MTPILNNCLKQSSMTYVWMGSEIPDMLHDQFWGYSRNLTKPKPGAQGQSNMQMKF